MSINSNVNKIRVKGVNYNISQDASKVSFDRTVSNTEATNIQEAIDEIYNDISQLQEDGRFNIEGNVINNPDEDDITTVLDSQTGVGVLKIKDRAYVPVENTKGYCILRSDSPIEEQIAGKTNTIFEVRYNFNLRVGDVYETVNLSSQSVTSSFKYYKSENPIDLSQFTEGDVIRALDGCIFINSSNTEYGDTIVLPSSDSVYIAKKTLIQRKPIKLTAVATCTTSGMKSASSLETGKQHYLSDAISLLKGDSITLGQGEVLYDLNKQQVTVSNNEYVMQADSVVYVGNSTAGADIRSTIVCSRSVDSVVPLSLYSNINGNSYDRSDAVPLQTLSGNLISLFPVESSNVGTPSLVLSIPSECAVLNQLGTVRQEPDFVGGTDYTLTNNTTHALLYTPCIALNSNIYEASYDVCKKLTLPAGSVLKFNGGSIANGIIVGNNTKVDTDNVLIFDNVSFDGSWNSMCNVCWFGADSSSSNNSQAFQDAINTPFKDIFVPNGEYKIDIPLNIDNKEVHFHFENSTTKLYTLNDIPLLWIGGDKLIGSSNPFSIDGGVLDVSEVNSYSQSVILFGGIFNGFEKGRHSQPVVIKTKILGKELAPGWHGTGTAIRFAANSDVTKSGCASAFINIESNIRFFEYGIRFEANGASESWITNFEDNSIIYHCKTHIYCKSAYVGKFIGSYQCGYVSENMNDNEYPAVHIKDAYDIYLNCNIWDTGNRWNGVSVFFDNVYDVNVDGNTMRSYSAFKGYEGTNYIWEKEYLPRNTNELYSVGYKELHNWFLLSSDFTATAEPENCVIGSDFANCLFREDIDRDSNKILVSNLTYNSSVTVNIVFNKKVHLTMLGTLLEIPKTAAYSSFSKIDVTPTFVNGTEAENATITYDVPKSNSAIAGYVYFTKNKWSSKTKKIESLSIKYYAPLGGGKYTRIHSIFGNIRGKNIRYLSEGGGMLTGGSLNRVDGAVIPLQTYDTFEDATSASNAANYKSLSVGTSNFIKDTKQFIVRQSTANNDYSFIIPLKKEKSYYSNRPQGLLGIGYAIIDGTMNVPLFWDGNDWIDGYYGIPWWKTVIENEGEENETVSYEAIKRFGSLENRPLKTDITDNPHFMYYATDIKRPIYSAGNTQNSTNTYWYNADGTHLNTAHTGWYNGFPLDNRTWNIPYGFVYIDKTNGIPIFKQKEDTDGYTNIFIDAFGNPSNTKYRGDTATRPTGVKVGTCYFDTSLTPARPIWASAVNSQTGAVTWVDATGAAV